MPCMRRQSKGLFIHLTFCTGKFRWRLLYFPYNNKRSCVFVGQRIFKAFFCLSPENLHGALSFFQLIVSVGTFKGGKNAPYFYKRQAVFAQIGEICHCPCRGDVKPFTVRSVSAQFLRPAVNAFRFKSQPV